MLLEKRGDQLALLESQAWSSSLHSGSSGEQDFKCTTSSNDFSWKTRGQTLPVQGRTDQANPVKTDVIAWRWLYAEYLPESGSGTAETDASYSPYRPRGAGVCRAFLEGRGIAAASVGKDI